MKKVQLVCMRSYVKCACEIAAHDALRLRSRTLTQNVVSYIKQETIILFKGFHRKDDSSTVQEHVQREQVECGCCTCGGIKLSRASERRSACLRLSCCFLTYPQSPTEILP